MNMLGYDFSQDTSATISGDTINQIHHRMSEYRTEDHDREIQDLNDILLIRYLMNRHNATLLRSDDGEPLFVLRSSTPTYRMEDLLAAAQDAGVDIDQFRLDDGTEIRPVYVPRSVTLSAEDSEQIVGTWQQRLAANPA